MAKGDIVDMTEADRADGCAHPRNVYTLIGHEAAERRFAQAFNDGKLHHAWLISGPKGVGKATLAYRAIRRVLGGTPQSEALLDIPQTDPVAMRIASLGHGDFLLIRRPVDERTKKLKSEIPVSLARTVRQFFSKKAAEGGWRVCLIDSIDEMNRSAANALLKTLEEPPEKCLLILLSQAPGRLLPTIRSRCMHLPLRAVANDLYGDWLGQYGGSETDINLAMDLANGAPGKAVALIQNADTVLRPLSQFIESFPKPNPRLVHSISDMLALPKSNISYGLFWDALLDIVQKQAIYQATGEWDGPFQPIALNKPTGVWLTLEQELKSMRSAQAGLNMNKKTVLLQALSQIGAA